MCPIALARSSAAMAQFVRAGVGVSHGRTHKSPSRCTTAWITSVTGIPDPVGTAGPRGPGSARFPSGLSGPAAGGSSSCVSPTSRRMSALRTRYRVPIRSTGQGELLGACHLVRLRPPEAERAARGHQVHGNGKVPQFMLAQRGHPGSVHRRPPIYAVRSSGVTRTAAPIFESRSVAAHDPAGRPACYCRKDLTFRGLAYRRVPQRGAFTLWACLEVSRRCSSRSDLTGAPCWPQGRSNRSGAASRRRASHSTRYSLRPACTDCRPGREARPQSTSRHGRARSHAGRQPLNEASHRRLRSG